MGDGSQEHRDSSHEIELLPVSHSGLRVAGAAPEDNATESLLSKSNDAQDVATRVKGDYIGEGGTLIADSIPLLSPNSAKLLSSGVKQSNGASHGNFDGASVSSAVFNLSTTVIGAGIMALPATMKVLGLPLGICLIVALGCLSELSTRWIVKFSTPMKASSYAEVVESVCGRMGRAVLQFCIIFGNSGILIVYAIIIGDVFSGTGTASGATASSSSSSPHHHTGLLEEWGFGGGGGGARFWTSRPLVLFILNIIVLGPLCLLQRLDSLRFTSAISMALAVLFVVITIGVFLLKLASGDVATPRLLPDLGSVEALLRLAAIVPIMAVAYVCQYNVHPIWMELSVRDEATILCVVRRTFFLCTAIYSAVATSGYLLFGDSIANDILSNFDTDLGIPFSWAVNAAVRLGYAVHVLLVFPLVHHALRLSLFSALFPRLGSISGHPLISHALTLALLSLVLVAATAVPNIWTAFEITGSTTSVTIAFILPAIIAGWSTCLDITTSLWEKRSAVAMLILGLVFGLMGAGSSIYQLLASSMLHGRS